MFTEINKIVYKLNFLMLGIYFSISFSVGLTIVFKTTRFK